MVQKISDKLNERATEVSNTCGFRLTLTKSDDNNITLYGQNYEKKSDGEIDTKDELILQSDPMETGLNDDGAKKVLDSLEQYCINYRVKDQLMLKYPEQFK